MSGIYPNAFYRVSLKAIIRNNKNEVLVVRENDDHWSLVGGGMDHEESVHQALSRELYEEALITAPFRETFVGIEPVYLAQFETWMLWVVYAVELEDGYEYGIGQDADAVKFIDPLLFKDSEAIGERLTYKFCVEINTEELRL